MIDFDKNVVSLDLFRYVLKEIKNTDRDMDIIDSFSDNQLKSKKELLKMIDEHTTLTAESHVAIFGCWYGSILIPKLAPRVGEIIAMDIDEFSIRIGMNRFFKEYTNVVWVCDDVFKRWMKNYSKTTLFINTSCEHMPPMKDWPWWSRIGTGAYFAFQSNNMFGIDGHVNCVNSISEFSKQLPANFEVLSGNELDDGRGIRYTIVGRIT